MKSALSQLVSDSVMCLVISSRSFIRTPNLDENELSKTKDKPKRISGFRPAHNLATREEKQMLGFSAIP